VFVASLISQEWKKALHMICDAKTNNKVTGKQKNRQTKLAGKAEI